MTLDGPELQIHPNTVQPLGLVIHELAMNAAQHGSLTRPEGRVAVAWMRTCNEGSFSIRWVERGGPPAREPMAAGFGLIIADGIVRRQLFGEVERRWKTSGLTATIHVPKAQP